MNFEEDSEDIQQNEHEEEEVEIAPIQFCPRSYQLELYDHAKEKNSILVLGTGSGKTFISILLIKELGENIIGSREEGAKRTVFVVNTVPLVHQQALAIEQHTPFKVGMFEGSMGVDYWSEEKWQEELDKYEVLVTVAEIFKELVLHDRLPLSKVNLLIVDECHHATGKHPMRETMREYHKLKDVVELPRVLGMTACVIHKKCRQTEVLKLMSGLEGVMDSVLVTSYDTLTVNKFVTKPQEMIIKCQNTLKSEHFLIVESMLTRIANNLEENIKALKTVGCEKWTAIQMIKKMVNGIINVGNELGEYIFPRAIELQAEYMEKAAPETDLERMYIEKLAVELGKIHSIVSDMNIELSRKHLSGKVLRLLEILTQKTNVEKHVLIFVQRRNTAKLLVTLLLELKKTNTELSNTGIMPECVVGGTFNFKVDLKVSQEEIRRQKETLARFRTGACNLIVSTSVLEEGMDVRKCNMVIRFNEPPNFRSYVQSLGRARAEKAYYLFLDAGLEDQILNDIYLYKTIQSCLLTLCHNRVVPSRETIMQGFAEDEIEPPFAPYGIPGPQVTFNSSTSLLNRYCGTLPQDKFTSLNINTDFRVIKKRDYLVEVEQFQAEISLPINSPYRGKVTGNIMNNRDEAKKSAGLKMCKVLFELGYLDAFLFPKKSKVLAEEILRSNIVELPDEKVEVGALKPGTRGRRQMYAKRISKPFKENKLNRYHLHFIDFIHTTTLNNGFYFDSIETATNVGFLCSSAIQCSNFNLHSKKWGEVEIRVKHVGEMELDADICDIVLSFHRNCLYFLLNTSDRNLENLIPNNSLYIVPLTLALNLDYELLLKFSEFSFNNEKRKKLNCDIVENFDFQFELFFNAIIMPYYRTKEIYTVSNIDLDLNPLSEFPDNKKEYKSYKDYVEKKYEVAVHNHTQPLLECKNFSNEFNYLPLIKDPRKETVREYPKFIPEMCIVFPLSSTLWSQLLCMPSILHRINGLMLEQELYKKINYRPNKLMENNFWCSKFSYPQVNDEIENIKPLLRTQNLGEILKHKNDFTIWPGMILQCLTPLSVNDYYNLERLEVLGDSFLKYSVGVYLFCKDTCSHEGTLSIQRSFIVSNKTLYLLAKEKSLSTYYQAKLLSASTAYPYGFYNPLPYDAKNVDNGRKSPNKKLKLDEEAKSDSSASAYEHEIPDKCLADSVEALIGVYLLAGGEKAAKHFMNFMKLDFIEKPIRFPTNGCVENSQVNLSIEVGRLYRKNCLNRLETEILDYKFREKSFLVQAVTHPSYTANKVTDCYQRLEFLGDSVLDYLISCYVFTTFTSYNPGQITDIRSHYVNNETLAKVAVKFRMQKYLFHMSPKLGSSIARFITLIEDGEKEFTRETDTLEIEDVEVPKALGDVVESLIGAIFVDSGGSLEITWRLIRKLLRDEFEATKTEIPINCVRELYEKNPQVKFIFEEVEEDEPCKCVVKMEEFKDLTGFGKNRRTAKQAAAKLALMHLKRAQTFPECPEELLEDF